MNFPPLLGGFIGRPDTAENTILHYMGTSLFHPENKVPWFFVFFILMSEFANIVRADGPFFFERPVTRKI